MDYATKAANDMLMQALNREMVALVEVHALRGQVAELEAAKAPVPSDGPTTEDLSGIREANLRTENRRLDQENAELRAELETLKALKKPRKV